MMVCNENKNKIATYTGTKKIQVLTMRIRKIRMKITPRKKIKNIPKQHVMNQFSVTFVALH